MVVEIVAALAIDGSAPGERDSIFPAHLKILPRKGREQAEVASVAQYTRHQRSKLADNRRRGLRLRFFQMRGRERLAGSGC